MIRKWCVYKLKEARNRKIETLGPLLTNGIAETDKDDDTDSGISSHGTGSGTGSIPSPDLSKAELAARLRSASLKNPAYLKAKVLWDFESTRKGTELSVVKGESVHLLYREHDKVLVVNACGRKGFIPFSYCSLPHRNIDTSTSRSTEFSSPYKPANKTKKHLYRNPSFHEFLDDMDLLNINCSGKYRIGSNCRRALDFKTLQSRSFSEEGLFDNTSTSSEEDGSCCRQTSGFPDTIRWNRKAPESFRQRQKSILTHFRKCDEWNMMVLYDFAARAENDISVYKGDIVRVLNMEDRDWWWVLTRTRHEGFVPSSYLLRQSRVSSQESTPNSVESTSSSTSEGSSTQAVRFQDPLCTFHRYVKEDWETESEASPNDARYAITDENDQECDDYVDSKWSTWC